MRARRDGWVGGGPGCAPDEECGCDDDLGQGTWRKHIRDMLEGEPGEHWFFRGRRFMGWWTGPGRINPLVGLLLSKGGGVLPVLVLHLLAQGPRYGNDIMREIQLRSKGTWASNPGAVYPLLRLLEHQGLVTGAWEDEAKRTRRVYQLTQEGKKEYAYLKDLMKPGLQEAIEVMRALFAELYADGAPVEPASNE